MPRQRSAIKDIRNINSSRFSPVKPIELPDNIPIREALQALIVAALKGADKFTDSNQNTSPEILPTSEFCIRNFKENYTDQIKEMMDSVDKSPITVAVSGNGTGKTHAAARIAVAYLHQYRNRGVQVYTAAAPPERNLKRLLWGEIGALVQKYPKKFEEYKVSLPGLHIEDFKDVQNFITGVTIPSTGTEKEQEARFSGKHRPVLLFILDEGDAIPSAVYKGIESCLSGGHGRLLILFNPRHKSGPVYNMIRSEACTVVKLEPFQHPNVITGNDLFPGAVDRNTTGRRILRWTRPLAPGEPESLDTFRVPHYFDGFQPIDFNGKLMDPIKGGQPRLIVDSSFHYMVLAQYPTITDDQLISSAWIEAANARWRRMVALGDRHCKKGRPRAGLDVAEMGKDKTVLTLVYDNWVSYPFAWQHKDPLQTGDEAAEICINSNALYCNVDSTGVGAGTAPQMRRAGFYNANRVMMASSPPEKEMSQEQKELGSFRNVRDYVWWGIRDWLKNCPDAALPPCEELERDLLAATYRIEAGKIKILSSDKIREITRYSPDYGTSLGLALMSSIRDSSEKPPAKIRSVKYLNSGNNRLSAFKRRS
jgi:hypothetical protein